MVLIAEEYPEFPTCVHLLFFSVFLTFILEENEFYKLPLVIFHTLSVSFYPESLFFLSICLLRKMEEMRERNAKNMRT